ncbi:site-specific integrase [Diaphorobacter sp. JS3050]|uniref:tyrosine-type recombinase/integrase n=1 Tax=Diaphorobacter sp. JS3050 TaxID=2735554 RepID=UPI001553CB2A|nr:site-specific integrase [Diaphorobacter sp. JS3050]QJY33652.1 site-specific integrase [Diaphorobacter sp. JS3050]
MASIRERIDASGKKKYHVQIRLKGFPPQTETFNSKTIAKQWAQRVETELREGRYMPHALAQRRTVKEMLESYRDRVLIPTKPKRVRDQGQQLQWWIDKIGRYSLADITPAIIGQYRDELLATTFGKANPKKLAPATVVRYLAILSHAFSVAVKEWEWLPESPMPKVKKPKVSNGRVRYLSADELARLRAAAAASENKFLPTVIEVAVATGMRYSEIMNLRWRDVLTDAQGRCSLAVLEETKNGERRGVPLLGTAQVALDALRLAHKQANGDKVSLDTLLFPSAAKKDAPVELRKSWETALKRAKIEDFRFHDLRHTAASFMVQSGATAPEIAEVLGHKDLQMVKRYAHLSKDHIAGVLSRMNQAMLAGPPVTAEASRDGS